MTTAGRLIALEGGRGADVPAAARKLFRRLANGAEMGGTSRWDASGIFYELRWSGPGATPPSPRTLVMLYAADLAFRLHWDIRPTLEEGKCVIAAPYVETAIAFGRAAGLSRSWLADLFRFAPSPEQSWRIAETPWTRPDGFLGFCFNVLRAGSPEWDEEEVRRKISGRLDALESCRKIQALPLSETAGITPPAPVRRRIRLTVSGSPDRLFSPPPLVVCPD